MNVDCGKQDSSQPTKNSFLRWLCQLLKSRYLPIVLLCIGYTVLTFCVKVIMNDDYIFGEMARQTPLGEILRDRYYEWTSRIIIEAVMFPLTKSSLIVWKLLNSAVCIATILMLCYLFCPSRCRWATWLLAAMLAVTPMEFMRSAGWITTTINYVWPLCAFLATLIPIKRIFEGRGINSVYNLFYIPAILFCTSSELVALILSIVSVALIVYSVVTKRFEYYFILLAVLSVAAVLFAMTCPGNAVRLELEIVRWLPEFVSFSLVRKLLLGLLNVFNYLVFAQTPLALILALLAAVAVFMTHKSLFYRAIALFAPATIVIILLTRPFVEYKGVYYGFDAPPSGSGFFSYWAAGLAIIFFLALGLSMYLALGNTRKTAVALTLFYAGFASNMSIALSPTIYASGPRVSFCLLIIIMAVGLMLFEQISLRIASNKSTSTTATPSQTSVNSINNRLIRAIVIASFAAAFLVVLVSYLGA